MTAVTEQNRGRLEGDHIAPERHLDAEAFRTIAEYANEHQDDGERQAVVFAIVDLLSPHLDIQKTATWWLELLRALARAEAADTAGPAWDETGVDWAARAVEAAEMLAGPQ